MCVSNFLDYFTPVLTGGLRIPATVGKRRVAQGKCTFTFSQNGCEAFTGLGDCDDDTVSAFAFGLVQGAVRARKGIIITTSAFSQDAREYVQRIEMKIILIDGKQLTELMIDYDVGVTVAKEFKLKKLDADFFEPEQPRPICMKRSARMFLNRLSLHSQVGWRVARQPLVAQATPNHAVD